MLKNKKLVQYGEHHYEATRWFRCVATLAILFITMGCLGYIYYKIHERVSTFEIRNPGQKFDENIGG